MKKIRIAVTLMVFLLSLLLTSCGGDKKETADYYIYYISPEGTHLVSEAYTAKANKQSDLIKELIKVLNEEPSGGEFLRAMEEGVKIVKYEFDNSNGQLTLHFNKAYDDMSNAKEILVRGAVVKTLAQVSKVENISFYIGNESKEGLSALTADTFIVDDGDPLESYESTTITLYFADESGRKLVKETRNVGYKSNVSMVKTIIEQLVKGPKIEGAQAVFSSDLKLLSSSVKDGVCYLNFDEGFLNQSFDLDEEIPIYALVNSLVEQPDISKVQISVNGEMTASFRGNIKLDTLFERKLDLVLEK